MYIPTLGVEVHPLVVNTNHGRMRLNVWDCAGLERYGGLRDGYYIQADGAMVFSANPHPIDEYRKWCSDLRRTLEDRPMLCVHTKCDMGRCDQNVLSITREQPESMLLPIKAMLCRLTGHNDLVIVAE
jgi:GTPase SAR1 family protein